MIKTSFIEHFVNVVRDGGCGIPKGIVFVSATACYDDSGIFAENGFTITFIECTELRFFDRTLSVLNHCPKCLSKVRH
ncbi:hypothetical protein BGS_0092 [Beggiatoa sp. SS]|nr:hypothetical protein BGS_0092 [Beggiatoa sp. SS]